MINNALCQVYKCSDWIITSKAIHPASVTFLLSHNVMEVWQLMENSQAELVRTFSFEHMSIMLVFFFIFTYEGLPDLLCLFSRYSGFIAGETLPDLAVFSGTVFNQIQLYLPHSSEKCVQQLDSHTV